MGIKFRSLLHEYPRAPVVQLTPKIMQSPLSNIPYSTIDLTTLRQHLLDLLCQLAYKEGDFTLSSGQKSTYYINGKQVTLHPEGAVATSRILLSMLPVDTDAVAGLTLGADPIVAGVSGQHR